MKRIGITALLLTCMAMLTSCGDDHKDHAHKDHDHDHDHDHAGHAHAAPRGGTLVELGNHEANVELLLDPERKLLSLYVLDAHAESAVKIEQAQVEIQIVSAQTGTPINGWDYSVVLKAVANENTGEKVGDTSQFEVAQNALMGLTTFDGIIKSLTIKGATYTDVKFSFNPQSKK